MDEIVVGVDGSVGAAEALRWAAREAELRSWRLRAVLAWDYLDQHHPGGARRFDPDYDAAAAGRALDGYVDDAFAPGSPPPLERATVCDLPARGLLATARGASLLVVGARGLGGFRELMLGSVSQQCLQHSTCPVAVARPAPRPTEAGTGRIVVGVDGSPGGLRALEWAVAEAGVRRGSVEVVHAWHASYRGETPFAAAVPGDLLADRAREVVADALEHVDTSVLAEPPCAVVTMDEPANAILQRAADAELVVVGSRGHGGFAGLLLGSVSHHVSHHVPCPVVVVPEGR